MEEEEEGAEEDAPRGPRRGLYPRDFGPQRHRPKPAGQRCAHPVHAPLLKRWSQ
jgi:hypothetical protein